MMRHARPESRTQACHRPVAAEEEEEEEKEVDDDECAVLRSLPQDRNSPPIKKSLGSVGERCVKKRRDACVVRSL